MIEGVRESTGFAHELMGESNVDSEGEERDRIEER